MAWSGQICEERKEIQQRFDKRRSYRLSFENVAKRILFPYFIIKMTTTTPYSLFLNYFVSDCTYIFAIE